MKIILELKNFIIASYIRNGTIRLSPLLLSYLIIELTLLPINYLQMRVILLIIIFCTTSNINLISQDAKSLLTEAVAAVGGVDAMYKLKDVSFSYSYGGGSQERYIFDKEISWGKTQLKDGTTRIQFYDGNTVHVWIDGKKTEDEKAIQSAWFGRKTNYYWLAMIQKLADPGVIATYSGKRIYEGIEYDLLDITYEDGVGVAKDRYLLYVNPYTKMVDQFLFTVAAVGRQDPIMMKYQYDTFEHGVKFPVVGTSRAALNWDGDLDPEAKWGARHRSNFKFNNGYSVKSILK